MNTLIVYASRHHGSTEKLTKALAAACAIDLLDADSAAEADLAQYDIIGFASGIDFGKLYPSVTALAETLPAGKAVYALFTCARDNGKYGEQIQDIAIRRGCDYLGKFGCRGYNTYGLWKLIGGMNKQHPSQQELTAAIRFYQTVVESARR